MASLQLWCAWSQSPGASTSRHPLDQAQPHLRLPAVWAKRQAAALRPLSFLRPAPAATEASLRSAMELYPSYSAKMSRHPIYSVTKNSLAHSILYWKIKIQTSKKGPTSLQCDGPSPKRLMRKVGSRKLDAHGNCRHLIWLFDLTEYLIIRN